MEEKQLIKQALAKIVSQSELQRKEQSQTEWDIYTGNINPYVKQAIADRFSYKLANEVPIISAVNLLKKIVNQKASLYKSEPKRDFTELSDEQLQFVEEQYNEMRVNYTMLESNKLFELQKEQTHILIEAVEGEDEEKEIRMRPVKAHHLSINESEQNCEKADVYVFSAYDRNFNDSYYTSDDDSLDLSVQKSKKKFVLWSKDYHFIFDGNGHILSEDTTNELGVIPIVEVSAMKDFLYWRELTNDVAQFCIDYNVSLSMLQQITELSSFAQAYLKSPENLMPELIEVGPNRILKLITNPDQDGDVEFGYASPNADIASAQAFQESILAQFLSSQGLDANLVSGKAQADKFNSGVERLLAMIEKFEASKEVQSLFGKAEKNIYEILKSWWSLLDIIKLPEESKLTIAYAEPQSLLSEIEKLDIAERKIDLGVWDEVDVISFLENVERDVAEDKAKEIEDRLMKNKDDDGDTSIEPDIKNNRSQPEDRP